eukprot:Hpha_TRINITY_DN20070_c0_g1::TRINITY_DN20070_c0_g1_i1::g.147868::m.147868
MAGTASVPTDVDKVLRALVDWWEDGEEDAIINVCPAPLLGDLTEFATAHASSFPMPTQAGEIPEQLTEHMDIFEKYRALIEERLESFLKSQDITGDEFAECIAIEAQRRGQANLRWIVALSDYRTFYELMCEIRSGAEVCG